MGRLMEAAGVVKESDGNSRFLAIKPFGKQSESFLMF